MFRPQMTLLAVAAAWMLMAGTPARADISFLLGNNPQPAEENIFFGQPSQVGPVVLGFTKQLTNVEVAFATVTNQTLLGDGGQAKLNAVISPTDLTLVPMTSVQVSIPNGSFGDLIINPEVTSLGAVGGSATVTVTALLNGAPETIAPFTYTLANGNNFLTILSVAGTNETITSVTVTATTGFTGFDFTDLKQPRISGVQGGTPIPTPIPEPSTLAIAGLGALGFLGYGLRRRLKK